MVKTGVFKKIAALTAAVAMVSAFAASACAVRVETTTQYVVGEETKVNVIANVSELGGAVEVTYYATNGDDVVFVDQTTAEDDGTASFDYVTAATNLKSAVKVGYDEAPAAVDGDVPVYTISGEGITTVEVPTLNIDGTHTLAYTLPEGKVYKDVTAVGADVTSAEYADGTLTVILANATGNVVLTVNTDNAIILNPTGSFVDGAAIVSDGTVDEGGEDVAAEEGNRKVTVIGQVADTTEYGIIVSAVAITAGEVDELPAGNYAAQGKNDAGYFAVQVIDNGNDTAEEALFQSGVAYNTAVYYKNANTGKYVIVAGNSVTAE